MRTVGVVFVLLFSSCAPIEPLWPRASFDLECSRESLRYVELGDDIYGVSGCGKRATYQYMCGIDRVTPNLSTGGVITHRKCQWVRN